MDEYIDRGTAIAKLTALRIIDANALLDCLDADQPYNWTDSDAEIQAVADWEQFKDMINAQPTISGVEPVVEAEWIDKPTGRYGQKQSWCSACGEHNRIGGIESNRHRPRCPHCGAHMKNEG